MTTIKDIAEAFGVAPSTVSRALHHHPDIAIATREAIEAYAHEHNYRRNLMASSLRTRKNTTIGLVVPSATENFYARVLQGVEKTATAAGYNVIIKQDASMDEALETLLSLQVSGMLACVGHRTMIEAPEQVISANIPLVVVGAQLPCECDQVVSDDFGGAFRAVEYLIQTGARRIAYYAHSTTHDLTDERFQGYRSALEKYGIRFDPDLVLSCSNRTEALVLTPDFLRRTGGVDAILAAGDHMAAGILQAAKMLGIRVPDQLQICGFSNHMLTRHTDPMLTTVQQHAEEMGSIAADMLIRRIEEEEKSGAEKRQPEVVKHATDLIVRETTR